MSERKKLNPEQIEFLKKNIRSMSSRQIAAAIGISKTTVLFWAKTLGFQKYLDKRKNSTQFKKGCSSQNKGKKVEEFLTPEALEKFKAQMFKKGSIPHNALPDWSESIHFYKREQKYYVKVKVPSENHLVFKHRWLWEQHHGPIKKGEIITFKNGNTLDVRLENLEKITLKQNMLRNGIVSYPPEVRTLIKINANLKKLCT